MSTHTEHIDDLAEGYALGALEQSERVQVEQHIAVCPPCQQVLAKLEDAAHMLGFAVVAASPSIACKRRLMERVERELFLAASTPRRSRVPAWATTAWASLATLALVMMSVWTMSSQQQATAAHAESEALRAQMGQLQAQVAEHGVVDDLMIDGVERRLTALAAAPDARAICLMKPGEQEAILFVAGLKELPPGKTYQVWVAHGEEQAPSTVFEASSEGSSQQVKIVAPRPMDYYTAITVTVEDAPGAQQPSGETVLAGDL